MIQLIFTDPGQFFNILPSILHLIALILPQLIGLEVGPSFAAMEFSSIESSFVIQRSTAIEWLLTTTPVA